MPDLGEGNHRAAADALAAPRLPVPGTAGLDDLRPEGIGAALLRARGVDATTAVRIEKRTTAVHVDADTVSTLDQGFQIAATEPVAAQAQVRADVFLFSRADGDIVSRRAAGATAPAAGAFKPQCGSFVVRFGVQFVPPGGPWGRDTRGYRMGPGASRATG
jgi:hypothetical protein